MRHLAVAVAMLSGMGFLSPASAATVTAKRAVVLGDSLAAQMCGGDQQAIPTRTAKLIDVGCYGWPGATTTELRAYVDNASYRSAWAGMGAPNARFNLRQAIAEADVLILSLSTNDAKRDTVLYDTGRWPTGDGPWPYNHVPVDNGWFNQQIDWWMQQAQGKPVVWFDIGCRTNDSLFLYAAMHRDDVLRNAMGRWPNLRVVYWGGEISAHPEYLKDEVHMTQAGLDARWRLAVEFANK